MSTLKNTLLDLVARNSIRGITARQAAVKLNKVATRTGASPTPYSSVRGRLYEMAKVGTVVRFTDDNGISRFSQY